MSLKAPTDAIDEILRTDQSVIEGRSPARAKSRLPALRMQFPEDVVSPIGNDFERFEKRTDVEAAIVGFDDLDPMRQGRQGFPDRVSQLAGDEEVERRREVRDPAEELDRQLFVEEMQDKGAAQPTSRSLSDEAASFAGRNTKY